MAFGEAGPVLRVCCGPRCGAWPRHRAIYASIERVASNMTVEPVGCRGECGLGVTVVLPNASAIVKVTEPSDTEELTRALQQAQP